MEGLCQLETLSFRHLPAPLPQPTFEMRIGELPHLAVVASKSGNLDIESRGDIRVEVDVLRPVEEKLPDLVGLESSHQEVRISEVVPGEGEHRVEDDLPGNAVVPMPDVAAVRI
jgi:hypothetical protein